MIKLYRYKPTPEIKGYNGRSYLEMVELWEQNNYVETEFVDGNELDHCGRLYKFEVRM